MKTTQNINDIPLHYARTTYNPYGTMEEQGNFRVEEMFPDVLKTVFDKLGVSPPITTKINYMNFLHLTGKISFELTQRKASPLWLLDNLTEVVEDLPTQNKNPVFEALNSFFNHQKTSTWLNKLRNFLIWI